MTYLGGKALGAIMADHDRGPEYAVVQCIEPGCEASERVDDTRSMTDQQIVDVLAETGWSVKPTLCPEHQSGDPSGACQCEHESHEVGTAHRYLGVPANPRRVAMYVGPVCDDCAYGHLAEYMRHCDRCGSPDHWTDDHGSGDRCVREWPDPGHEDEGYSCSTHNTPWGECTGSGDSRSRS